MAHIDSLAHRTSSAKVMKTEVIAVAVVAGSAATVMAGAAGVAVAVAVLEYRKQNVPHQNSLQKNGAECCFLFFPRVELRWKRMFQ